MKNEGIPASTTTALPLAATMLADEGKLHSSSSSGCHAEPDHLRGEGTTLPPPPSPMATSSRTMSEPQDTKKIQNADGERSQGEASVQDLAMEAVMGAAEGGRSGIDKRREKSGEAIDEKAVIVHDVEKEGGGGEGTEQEQERVDHGDDDDDERREEQLADVERHTAKLYITILQRKHNERVLAGGDDMAMRSVSSTE